MKEWWSLWIGERSLPHPPQRLCKGDGPDILLQMWGLEVGMFPECPGIARDSQGEAGRKQSETDPE